MAEGNFECGSIQCSRKSKHLTGAWYRLVFVLVAASLLFYKCSSLLLIEQFAPVAQGQAGLSNLSHLRFLDQGNEEPHALASSHGVSVPPKNAIVVAATQEEDTGWLHTFEHSWNLSVYRVDGPTAALTVKHNKGHEGTAYLTYIIDNYYNLPEIVVFLHGRRYQWHNDEPMYDGIPLLARLHIDYVRSVGFANLRCTWYPGCPVNLHPTLQKMDDDYTYENAYASAWKEILPGDGLPAAVGASCCAQFAVSRERIQARSIHAYQRIRRWLWSTQLDAIKSGRILEYTWHILFGQEPVSCPDTSVCFCRLYGLCDLRCPSEGTCEGRWWPPWPLEKLPSRWPEEGQGRDGWPVTGWWEEHGLATSP